MNPVDPQVNKKEIAGTLLRPNGGALGNAAPGELAADPQFGPRNSGYGLPCAKCKTYYAADLTACPVCHGTERVAPATPMADARPAVESTADPAMVEEERERFLREFQSHVQASRLEINASATFRCSRSEDHQGAFEPATVCQGCYGRVQERADLLEAALLIDLRDATQIIYEAVWADPSDPTKTYQNAAQALLNEIRRRAGVSTILGPLQPLTH